MKSLELPPVDPGHWEFAHKFLHPYLQASEVTLRHYYDNLVGMLLAIETAERDSPGQGTPPLQVLPPPPTTPEEARKEASTVEKDQLGDNFVIFFSIAIALVFPASLIIVACLPS